MRLQALHRRLMELDQLCDYTRIEVTGEPWFKVQHGTAPVLVSAPHACMHVRDGVSKMQEEFTGAIAFYLAQTCDCYAMVTCCSSSEDPNWVMQGEYKSALQSLVQQNNIRFLIDLHGMTNRHQIGVAIGTMDGQSCDSETVVPCFTDAGFKLVTLNQKDSNTTDVWRRVVLNHPKFTGGLVNHTVTRFASQQLGIKAVQIELSSQARVVESQATSYWPHEYYGNPQAITASVGALQSLVESFND